MQVCFLLLSKIHLVFQLWPIVDLLSRICYIDFNIPPFLEGHLQLTPERNEAGRKISSLYPCQNSDWQDEIIQYTKGKNTYLHGTHHKPNSLCLCSPYELSTCCDTTSIGSRRESSGIILPTARVSLWF